MLRIVHPAPRGQGSDPPKRRRRERSAALSLTAEEGKHLAATLRNLRFGLGAWSVVAMVTGLPITLLTKVAQPGRKRGIHPAVALRAAKAAGLPVETVLSGAMRPADRCPTCGAHAADRRKGAA